MRVSGLQRWGCALLIMFWRDAQDNGLDVGAEWALARVNVVGCE